MHYPVLNKMPQASLTKDVHYSQSMGTGQDTYVQKLNLQIDLCPIIVLKTQDHMMKHRGRFHVMRYGSQSYTVLDISEFGYW